MKKLFFEVAQGGANVADANCGVAMVGDSISKHRRCSTSLKGRENLLRKVCFALLAASILYTANVSAQQKGDFAVGGHFSLLGMGVGPKLQYNVANKIRLEGAFTYYLLVSESRTFVDSEASLNSWWDITANAHFLIPAGKAVVLYPVVGLGMNKIVAKQVGYADESLTLPVINLGFGTEFKLGENIALNFELKIRVMALLTAGITYKF